MSSILPEKFETALETYSVDSILGQGGSGRVFLALDSHKEPHAVKYLSPELATATRLSRFRNELAFLRQNTHPNIVRVSDDGFLSIPGSQGKTKVPFYVMPVYPSTLRKLMAEPIEPSQVIGIFQKLLDGVEAAHQRSIWHRDLKPENVLVDPQNSSVVVADFGIAHFSEDELYTAVQTRHADRLANFQYAAPEQRNKGSDVDERADIYALGLLLNEMLTGEVPSGTEFKRVADIVPAMGYMDKLIDHMIRQSPNSRPSSINEVRLELLLAQQTNLSPARSVAIPAKGIAKPAADKIYKAEVDCIGRIEDREHPTVLSISAGLSHTIMVLAEDKQKALAQIGEWRPSWGRTRCRVFLFSLLLFLLLKDHMRKLDLVGIDPEYPGYEPQIKNTLLRLFREREVRVSKSQIQFLRIDRGSSARIMATRVYKQNADPDSIIGVKQILDLLQ